MDSGVVSIEDFRWSVETLAAALPEWRLNRERLHASITQDVTWCSIWQAQANADCIAVVARSDKGLEFVLTLEVIKRGILKTASVPGGTHANENFPATSPSFAALDPTLVIEKVRQLVRNERPDIDRIILPRQIIEQEGLANPILSLEQSSTTDVALALRLDQDFQKVLADKSGSRKQKKIRQMTKRMDERGGWQIIKAQTIPQVESILNCFYVLKQKRLAEKGIADVFGPKKVQDFFKAAFVDSIENDTGIFELYALEVGGSHVAIAGCTIRGKQFNVEFGGISDADANLSPGDFLFFYMIQDACRRGFSVFNFSTGDEHYKRLWCDIETAQYVAFVPLTLKGVLASRFDTFITATKFAIKSNDRLLSLAKAIRKKI